MCLQGELCVCASVCPGPHIEGRLPRQTGPGHREMDLDQLLSTVLCASGLMLKGTRFWGCAGAACCWLFLSNNPACQPEECLEGAEEGGV